MDSDSSGGAAAALADDSGLFSCSSEADETIDHSITEQEHVGYVGQQDSLFLVTQELRKSRSEIERLSKSEQWYKQELQTQKHNRLETLERLYAQERKYMLENQRLQQDAQRLEAKCASLESNSSSTQAAAATPILRILPTSSATSHSPDSFELEQHQAKLMDQRQLIEVLRKQKKELLADIQRLSMDHDERQLELQRQLAGVEFENKHMTRQCKQLLIEQRDLAHKLELKETSLRGVTAEREQLRQVIAELNETLQTQEQLLALKEREFIELKKHYQDKLSKESSIDAMHSYSLAFHGEINAKTSEIATLKHALNDLQTELLLMSQLQAQNEEQQRQLEQLNFQLEAQRLEQALKVAHLEDLSAEKAALATQLQQTQQTLQHVEQQLVLLQQQYAETCAKCEQTKLQLQQQQSQNDEQQQQLKDLREQLATYVEHCSHTEYKLEQQQQQQQDKCIQTIAHNTALEQRIESLEQQLMAVNKQKQQTVALLQQLLQQQNDKIRNTNEMESDWMQLLEALQATQKMEQQMQLQLQQKAEELQQLNELFAQQNEQLQQLQLLSRAHEAQNSNELQQLKDAQASDAETVGNLRLEVDHLLEELNNRKENQHTTLHVMQEILEYETGRRMQKIKSWPQFIKLLRQELRAGKMKLGKLSEKHETALTRIKVRTVLHLNISRLLILSTSLFSFWKKLWLQNVTVLRPLIRANPKLVPLP